MYKLRKAVIEEYHSRWRKHILQRAEVTVHLACLSNSEKTHIDEAEYARLGEVGGEVKMLRET